MYLHPATLRQGKHPRANRRRKPRRVAALAVLAILTAAPVIAIANHLLAG